MLMLLRRSPDEIFTANAFVLLIFHTFSLAECYRKAVRKQGCRLLIGLSLIHKVTFTGRMMLPSELGSAFTRLLFVVCFIKYECLTLMHLIPEREKYTLAALIPSCLYSNYALNMRVQGQN